MKLLRLLGFVAAVQTPVGSRETGKNWELLLLYFGKAESQGRGEHEERLEGGMIHEATHFSGSQRAEGESLSFSHPCFFHPTPWGGEGTESSS